MHWDIGILSLGIFPRLELLFYGSYEANLTFDDLVFASSDHRSDELLSLWRCVHKASFPPMQQQTLEVILPRPEPRLSLLRQQCVRRSAMTCSGCPEP
jgi:hypothetical protein